MEPLTVKHIQNSTIIESLVRHSGFVVMNKPSAEYPAAITLAYRNNRDGSVRWLRPQGAKHSDVLVFDHAAAKASWISRMCFSLGLGSLISDGKLKLYADPSTASYIRNNWHGNAA